LRRKFKLRLRRKFRLCFRRQGDLPIRRLLGLLEHVEDIERVSAERIGGRRSGVDRRQLRLLGARFGDLLLPAIRAVPPPPPSATSTASTGACRVVTRAGLGIRMFRNALDMLLQIRLVEAGRVTRELGLRPNGRRGRPRARPGGRCSG
jgi:hypothetical protein